jgi:quinoprotein glucose dehydrogenase
MTIEQPFWNHNGGTIVFGPDGYLYIGLGDGGAANDPHGNGQNLGTLLGSILRIDVDSKDEGLAYGIPDDNPFVGVEGARPEIYAYGIRNVWRIAFDRQTGKLWAGDVGQDLWEEIDIIEKGGNFGWNLREGMHPFKGGAEASDAFVEPIFEYHHDVGKSITGGHVYRGQRVPQLAGKYVYADYVTGDIWALDYDEAGRKVRGNYSISWEKLPVMTFGEDEQGEVYFTITSGQVYRFAPAK